MAEKIQDVFINCPFDRQYKRAFDAVVFSVFDCGFRARSALEITNTAEIRVEKIARIMEECSFGFHDISRTGLDRTTRLPRFNMPFELGLFLGISRRISHKSCLVVDRDKFRYQKFLSDIAGQDISAHHNSPETAIGVVRDWLGSSQKDVIPGPTHIWKRYQIFKKELPKIAEKLHLLPKEIKFNDYATIVGEWLKERQEF